MLFFLVKETFQLFAFSVTVPPHEWKSRRAGAYKDFLHLNIKPHLFMASKSICMALKPFMIHPFYETQDLSVLVCGASRYLYRKSVTQNCPWLARMISTARIQGVKTQFVLPDLSHPGFGKHAHQISALINAGRRQVNRKEDARCCAAG